MDGGYTLHTCSCGYSYKTDHTEARGHYYATSNSTCTRCGSAQHTHSYTSTVVAPTCTEGGYTLHTCQCGNSYKDTETAARGHFYATSTSPCSRCGHVQGEASGSSSSTIIKEYSYIYSGDTLVEMDVRTIVDNGTPVPDVLTFTYDANGYPATVTSNGVTYYYVTNLQGDVVAILDAGRSIVVQYTYDAWGQVLSTTGSLAATLGETNPLRYRGYVYDSESGLYYLQSRYYDPEVGRFLNADAYTSTGQGVFGNNMYSYCGNNPVIHADPNGTEYRLVGGGVQFEIDWGDAVVGVEVIVYWDVEECNDGGYQIALYSYGGVALPVDDPFLASLLTTITDNADILIGGSEAEIIALATLLSQEYSIGFSGVAIWGDQTFNSTEAYEGSFSSSGISGAGMRGSVALAPNCFALSLGANLVESSTLPSLSVSKTVYQQWMELNTLDILTPKKTISYGGGR